MESTPIEPDFFAGLISKEGAKKEIKGPTKEQERERRRLELQRQRLEK